MPDIRSLTNHRNEPEYAVRIVASDSIVTDMIRYSVSRPSASFELQRALPQLRAIRNLFQKPRQHGPPLFAHRSRQDHSLGLQAAHLSRREVGDDDHFSPDEFLRLVILRNAGEYLARLGLAHIDREPQQLV